MKCKVAPLSDIGLRKAKPRDKDYKLSDGKGLYLLITMAGGKYWRFDYSFDGKRKTLAFGTYPEISLVTARENQAAARALVAGGIDPSTDKKRKAVEKAIEAETFRSVALEWHTSNIAGKTKEYSDRVKNQLERFLFCSIGDKRLADVTTPLLYDLLTEIGKHSAYTAHRMKGITEAVYTYAITRGKAGSNPAVSLRGTLPKLSHKHFSAPTKPAELTPLLKAIDGYNNGYFAVKVALQLLPLFMVRPGVLQKMEWPEVDLDAAVWNIPAEKMKMKREHLVPLSKRAVELLKGIQIITGGGKYVFPSLKNPEKCISHNSFNEAFRYMGFSGEYVVAHGFRATARTMLHEILKFQPDVIEAQLAHKVPDRLGNAYNRAVHLEDRTRMMQIWSDYLDGLKAGCKVLPFKQVA